MLPIATSSDDEDSGVRPIHRARSWQKAARRLEKERKASTWHQTSAGTVSAPLIINHFAGELTEKMKVACKDFGLSMGMDVKVIERAGNSVRSDAKSEPLRDKTVEGVTACAAPLEMRGEVGGERNRNQ